MARNDPGPQVDRRKFLSGVAAAGAATAAAAMSTPVARAAEPAPAPRVPSALRPTLQVAAAETETPRETTNRIGGRPGSDFMVDVIKTLGIKYLPANCASSYRGIHESLINYGGNKMPEFLTCMHEESAVGMAHGYFKIAGKPLMTLCHGTVGLQHATMAIYNAWCDRVPVIVVGGNDMDAATRPPGVPTFHAAQDINALVRDFTKWDDTPVSLAHFPQGDSGAVKEAARLLAEAQNPVIVADRAARTPNGIKLLVQLAETLQARVIDQGSRVNFPKTHYLSAPPTAVSGADVILGLELSDFWATVNSYTDNGENGGIGANGTRIKPGTKLISISSVELNTKSNYQDFQRFQVIDVPMAGDAEATLPALIEAVKAAIPGSKKAAIEQRGQAAKKAHAEAEARAKQAAALGWDASPISTARLCAETYAAVKDLDWSIVSQSGNVSNWLNRLWPLSEHHHWIGRSGGYGVGYGAPASVGAALANRDAGRFSVNIQADGDLMYAPGVLWTAAKHKIPQLAVMHNNRGYHQEVTHVQRMANRRDRVLNDGPVGTQLDAPYIDYAKLAQSMGMYAIGPIEDPNELGPALKRAVQVVKAGEPALVDAVVQPR